MIGEEAKPHKSILGKEIVSQERDNFMSVGLTPDDDDIPVDDPGDE